MFLSGLEDGSSIFIGANIFIYHFSRESKLNPACSDFLERAELGKINGFTSASVVQEVTDRMMIIEAIALLTGIKARDMVKYLKAHPDIIKKLVTHQIIPGKIAYFNLEIISLEIDTIERSQQMKMRYGFLSNDALTLQDCFDLLSGDSLSFRGRG